MNSCDSPVAQFVAGHARLERVVAVRRVAESLRGGHSATVHSAQQHLEGSERGRYDKLDDTHSA